MNDIAVEDGLTVRFPEREPDFIEGVEIGLLLALLASGQSDVMQTIRTSSLEQAQALAAQFGYRCIASRQDSSNRITVHVTNRRFRPRLVAV